MLESIQIQNDPVLVKIDVLNEPEVNLAITNPGRSLDLSQLLAAIRDALTKPEKPEPMVGG